MLDGSPIRKNASERTCKHNERDPSIITVNDWGGEVSEPLASSEIIGKNDEWVDREWLDETTVRTCLRSKH